VAKPAGGLVERAGGEVPTRLFWASYPGVPEAAGEARHHVEQVLADVPSVDEVVFALGEVATNAIVHSNSGLPGGHFTVAADASHGVLVAIAVTDEGGPWRDRAPDIYPHGLEIVRQMASSVRITGGDAGRTAMLAFPWTPEPA
jgi:anti-sigma regulatory factor (Ser/Thr protein kinase)